MLLLVATYAYTDTLFARSNYLSCYVSLLVMAYAILETSHVVLLVARRHCTINLTGHIKYDLVLPHGQLYNAKPLFII